MRGGFPYAQQQEGNDREDEAGGIDDGDDVRADGNEQAGPGQGPDQAQRLLGGAEGGVGVGQQVCGDHDGQQGRLGRPENAV